jgi:hypothetical protein
MYFRSEVFGSKGRLPVTKLATNMYPEMRKLFGRGCWSTAFDALLTVKKSMKVFIDCEFGIMSERR